MRPSDVRVYSTHVYWGGSGSTSRTRGGVTFLRRPTLTGLFLSEGLHVRNLRRGERWHVRRSSSIRIPRLSQSSLYRIPQLNAMRPFPCCCRDFHIRRFFRRNALVVHEGKGRDWYVRRIVSCNARVPQQVEHCGSVSSEGKRGEKFNRKVA
jgi:hypothetical protein